MRTKTIAVSLSGGYEKAIEAVDEKTNAFLATCQLKEVVSIKDSIEKSLHSLSGQAKNMGDCRADHAPHFIRRIDYDYDE